MSKPAPPIPTRAMFRTPTEFVVHVPADAKPDDFNRLRFDAFWPTDQEWVPGGVRGQVFHSDLDEFTARAGRDGRTVRVVRFAKQDICPCCGATVLLAEVDGDVSRRDWVDAGGTPH